MIFSIIRGDVHAEQVYRFVSGAISLIQSKLIQVHRERILAALRGVLAGTETSR